MINVISLYIKTVLTHSNSPICFETYLLLKIGVHWIQWVGDRANLYSLPYLSSPYWDNRKMFYLILD